MAERAALKWPLRAGGDFLRSEPAESYAPEMTIRWQADSSPATRSAALAAWSDGDRGRRSAGAAGAAVAAIGRLAEGGYRGSARRGHGRCRARFRGVFVGAVAALGSRAIQCSVAPLYGAARYRPADRCRCRRRHDPAHDAVAGRALAGPTLRRRLPPAVTPCRYCCSRSSPRSSTSDCSAIHMNRAPPT